MRTVPEDFRYFWVGIKFIPFVKGPANGPGLFSYLRSLRSLVPLADSRGAHPRFGVTFAFFSNVPLGPLFILISWRAADVDSPAVFDENFFQR